MLIVVSCRNDISLRCSSIAKNTDNFVLISSQTVHCVEQSSGIAVWIKRSGRYQSWYILQLVANNKKKTNTINKSLKKKSMIKAQTQPTCPKMVPKDKTKKMNKNPMAEVALIKYICLYC